MSARDPRPEHLARRDDRGHAERGGPVQRRPARANATSAVQLLQRTLGNTRMAQLRAVQRQAAGQGSGVPAWLRDDLGISAAEQDRGEAEEAAAEAAPDTVHVPGGGDALPAEVQHRAEAHLGVGLDDVRLVQADETCRSVEAMAFCAQHDGGGHTIAVSNDVDLGSQDGQFTLAHELSHVAQQKQGRASALDGLGGDDAVREALETEADRDAHAMLRDAS